MKNGTHAVSQINLISTSSYYRVQFEASVADIEVGPELMSGAAVLLIYSREEGIRKVGAPFLVLPLVENSKRYHFNVHIRPDAESIELLLRLFKASGQFSIANLGFNQFHETTSFKLLKAGWSVVWIALGAFLIKLAARALHPIEFIAITLLCSVALIGALLPESMLNAMTDYVFAYSGRDSIVESADNQTSFLEPSKQERVSSQLSNIGHFLVFIGLGFMAGLRVRSTGFVFAVASVAASFGDLAIDVFGLLTGLFAACFILLICKLTGYRKISGC